MHFSIIKLTWPVPTGSAYLLNSFKRAVFSFLLAALAPAAFAQGVPAENAKAAEAFKGVWIIKIGNEQRTRTLVVGTKVAQENGETVVDGQFGFSDGGLVASPITISVKGGMPQAKVATPSPTALDFELITATSFEGRWLNRAGKTLSAAGQKFDPMAVAQAPSAATLPNKPVAIELKEGAALAPELKAGDTWRYLETDQRTNVKTRDIERRLVSLANGRWTGTENGGAYQVTPNLSLIESPNIKTTNGERNDIVFPLQLGAKWSQKYSWSNLTSGGKGGFEAEARVLSQEKIKTPAGEFDTFKVEIKGFWNNAVSGQNGRSTETYWYAPAVRNIVQRDFEDGFNRVRAVLVGFDLTP
jgi:hypothetical protein